MTSQAVYCLSLQIRPPSEENADGIVHDVGRNNGNVSTGTQATSSSSGSKAVGNLDKGLRATIEGGDQQNSNNNNSSATNHVITGPGGGNSSGSGGGGNGNVTVQHHHQHQQTTPHHQTIQHQQHSNIILVRGARTENGQIILQNSHELLSLLNDDDNKPIIFQHQRIKTATTTKSHTDGTSAGSTILLQTPIKSGHHQLEAGTVLLQSANIKKSILPEGSIILQQRLSKNTSIDGTLGGGTSTGTNTTSAGGGPFLLQTLKRLDKSQSILVFRNPNNATAHAVVGTASASVTSAGVSASSVAVATGTSSSSSSLSTSSGSTSSGTLAATLSISTQASLGGHGGNGGTKSGGFANRITKSNNINSGGGGGGNGNSNNNNNHNNGNHSNNSGNHGAIIGGNSGGGSLDDVEDKPEPAIQQKQMNVPLGSDGEPIKLPDNLESLPRADHFPTQRHRWNTNEEIAAILISFDKHSEWQSKEVKTRPKSGSMLLYSRKKVRYRRDGYCWKKRKDGKTTREDHMKLKVQGTECIYGCYVHSAILPTFHRRCYWLLQNPDIVLVHYLNVPYPDDNKMAVITPSLALWGDKKEWTKEELVSQLKPMFFSEDEPDATNEIEISTAETVEAIVSQLMEKQRLARQAALVKQLECGCPDSTCADGKSCSHPMRRINAAKSLTDKRPENNNQVSSTTPNVLIGPRLYSRWIDRRTREPITDLSQKTLDGSIHFQVIPSLHNHSNLSNHHHQQQQQQQQLHLNRQHNANLVHGSAASQLLSGSTSSQSVAVANSVAGTSSSGNQPFSNASNHGNQINRITNNNVSQMIINTSLHNGNTNSSSTTTSINTNNGHSSNSSNGSCNSTNNQMTSHSNQQISLTISSDNNNLNNLTNNDGQHHHHHHNHHHQQQQQQQQQQQHHLSMSGPASSAHHHHQQQQQQQTHPHHHHPHQQQQLHQQSIIDSNVVNQRLSSNLISNNSNGRLTVGGGGGGGMNGAPGSAGGSNIPGTVSGGNGSNGGRCNPSTPTVTSAPPLVLNLTQLQNSPGGLLILNGQQQSYVCQSPQQQQQQRRSCTPKDDNPSQSITPNLVPKQEAMDSTSSSSSDKHMDSLYDTLSYSSNNQTTPMESPSKESSLVKELNDSLPFFNETLDLSQEDIQKTLSANMPLSANGVSNGHEDGIDSDINPMDFIDNVCDVGGNSDPSGCAGPNGHDPDDVFVNLDAFDMLVEFPDLELDTKSAFPQDTMEHIRSQSVLHDGGDSLARTEVLNQETFNITDYSPEWAYPEGGVKVLVTGPWNSTSSYTVLFDSFPVPTTVVQSGVLRCYCPAHEVGLASLQVACDGYVISNSVIFEYKSPPNVETTCESTTNDTVYKFSLLNRLSSIDDRMQIKSEPKDMPEDIAILSQSNFEERLVNYCQLLTNKTWRSMTPGSWPAGNKGMTLLHLASALGYSKLVCAMLTWRSENPNVILETEIDALSQDVQGYTPLTWACARGHSETAVILYKWNHNSLKIKNCVQQTPIEIAKANGFTNLFMELERLESDRLNGQQQNISSLSLTFTTDQENTLKINGSSSNDDNLKSHFTYDKSSNSSQNNSNNDKNNNNNNSHSLITNKSANSRIIANNLDEQSSYNSNINHNDVKSNSEQQSLTPNQQQYSNNSPINNSNNNNSHSKQNKTDQNKTDNENTNNGNNNRNSINNNLNNENILQQCSSPTSTGSITSVASNRSHDGVFLRPGAVSSGQSPPGVRLSKRSSVDSGINMDIRSTFSRSGKMFRDQQKFQSFDTTENNFSLSMDSAMDGNSGTGSSTTSGSLLSPLRKMDFALCEVSAGDSSPIQDKRPGSSSDDEDITDPNNLTEHGVVVVGESDAKVLTLAEHIIAAMPERIKNESEEIMSLGSPMSESLNTDTPGMNSLNDSFMEPLLDSLPNPQFDHEFNFEFSDHSYRYHDVGTPCSSLSPASSGPLQSPASYSIPPDPPMSSPSPPPSAQELTEFLQASNISQRPFEADFSNLTLTDREQRELYEAAKCIQKAYRSYKGRKKLEEQDKERSAAIVIQNYYRRYKQFAYYRQMTHAALVIQNGYRSYCENKRFKKSQNQTSSTESQDSQCLQNYYKTYQNDQQHNISNGGGTMSKEPSPSGPLKRTYSQRTQNQAARKIQQFMRQSKMKLQKERAEKERLAHQRRADYLQNLQPHGQPEIVRIQEQNEVQRTPQYHLNSLNAMEPRNTFWSP